MLFSAVFSAMFDALYKRRYQRVYDAMLAAPVDVDEIVTGESLFLGVRAGVYGVSAAAGRVLLRPAARARDGAGAVDRRR